MYQVQHTVSFPTLGYTHLLCGSDNRKKAGCAQRGAIYPWHAHVPASISLCSTFVHRILGKCSALCVHALCHVHTLLRISAVSVSTCCWDQSQQKQVQLQQWEAMEVERKWEADQGNVSKWDEERGKGQTRARCPGLKRNRRKLGCKVATPCWYGKIKACR